ncbi:MAG TPA: L,D-transpeptidase family protein [Pyrinomonadaceae bacterium]|jgi:L,D-transpeptidase catalytic domain/Putative peptidoglycan binding domain
MNAIRKSTPRLIFSFCFLLAISTQSSAAESKKRHERRPNRAEAKAAEQRLADMGYWTGRIDGEIDPATRAGLIAFQKMEGRKVTGRLTRDELEAIRNAAPPRARELGYKHVEVDLDHQVLLLLNDEGAVDRILPVSTGSGKHYNEKGMKGMAYTPRGRFRVYGKASGWKRSPLGLLYYPNYISGGVAIHGNPEVPIEPKSHGCIRVPMFASRDVSKMLPVGTIVLIYDHESFVSAKDWAEQDKLKRVANVQ